MKVDLRLIGYALALTSLTTLTGCMEADHPGPPPAATTDSTSQTPVSTEDSSASGLRVAKAPYPASIDVIQGKPLAKRTEIQVHKGEVLNLAGWAIDQSMDAPGSSVDLVIDDKVVSQGKYGVKRPDLVQGFKKQSYLGSGYTITYNCDLPPGAHKAALRIVGTNSKYYYEPFKFTISVQ